MLGNYAQGAQFAKKAVHIMHKKRGKEINRALKSSSNDHILCRLGSDAPPPHDRVVQPTMHMCRQTKSIMCMHMCTHAQNVFADRGNELKQALFDRRLWKELDLLLVNLTGQSQDSQIRSKP
jgi:hypothetical protein